MSWGSPWVTVLGWRNSHGAKISHDHLLRQVINLGALDSQGVVDGLQQISKFLDSYEEERSEELVEGKVLQKRKTSICLLSPWLLIFPGNPLLESIGNIFYFFGGGSNMQIQAKTFMTKSDWQLGHGTFDLTNWLWPAIPSLRIVEIVCLRLELCPRSHWRLARWLAAGNAFTDEQTG